MQIQQLAEERRVMEGYTPGAGATPVRRTSRVGSTALVTPAPGHTDIRSTSSSDSKRIWDGYKPDQSTIGR